MHYAVQGYIHVWFQFNGFNYIVCSIIHTLGPINEGHTTIEPQVNIHRYDI